MTAGMKPCGQEKIKMKKTSRMTPLSWKHNILGVAVASCFATQAAYAAGPVLPNGPTVINGKVFFNYNGNLLQITNTPGAVINWQTFSIGASEVARFIQQSASRTVLNRVTAGNPSVILGALQSQLANGETGGRVYLINRASWCSGRVLKSTPAGWWCRRWVCPTPTLLRAATGSPRCRAPVQSSTREK